MNEKYRYRRFVWHWALKRNRLILEPWGLHGVHVIQYSKQFFQMFHISVLNAQIHLLLCELPDTQTTDIQHITQSIYICRLCTTTEITSTLHTKILKNKWSPTSTYTIQLHFILFLGSLLRLILMACSIVVRQLAISFSNSCLVNNKHKPCTEWVQALADILLRCHSNKTRAPTTNLPNDAQLEGIPYHSPKLHPGLCSSVGMQWGTDRQTDTQTAMATIHFTLAMPHAKCNTEQSGLQ